MSKRVWRNVTIVTVVSSLVLPMFGSFVRAAADPALSVTNVATDLTVPVAMQFAPDGDIFLAEKYGDIKNVNQDGSSSLFGSIDVNGDFEQGLLGMVLDPNFTTNGYIYVAYTRPDGDFNRVSRVTASANDHHKMVPGSEKVLIDNIPSPTGIHQMGEMQIGNDGKLYVPSGDGAIETQASGDLNTLSGKLLRINLDGGIPADNPFVGQANVRPEIWAYGLRNPFSSGKQTSTGKIFVNDVGRDTWEEINELKKGANYGFPQCEGKCQPAKAGYTDPMYQYSHYEGQSEISGRSITAGAWYEGNVYPADYNGDYFFGDYVAGWVKRYDPVTQKVTDVAEGLQGIVNLKAGPDGLMYAVQLDVNTGTGTIKKLNFGQPTSQPTGNTLTVYAAGTPAGGQYPDMQVLVNDKLVATQTGVTGNPYNRQFNEYTFTVPAGTTAQNIKLNYPNDALINGQDRNLTVDRIVINGKTVQTEDPSIYSTGSWAPDSGCNPGNKRSEELACSGYFQYGAAIENVNQKPVVTIDTPVAETHYNAGNTITFSGSANDAEDGVLSAAQMSWKVVFYHDTHNHPFLDFAKTNKGSFTIPDNGETAADTFYRITLNATDANGQTTSTSRDIFPNVIKLGMSTNIPGLGLTLDGEPRTVPLSINAVSGIKRSLGAPVSQIYQGKTYDFVSWSDGGAATHTITTPNVSSNYQANYALRSTTEPEEPPVTPPAGDTTTITILAAGSPADGVYPTMELQLDGTTVKSYADVRGNQNNRQFTQYTFTTNKTIKPSQVRVNFANDALINGEDRNLYVDKILINGSVYESEAQSTLSTGTWAPNSGCAPGNKQSETLSCGGYFAYDGAAPVQPPVQPTTSTLSIFAAGSPAAGVFPTLNVVVNGTVVKGFANVQGNYGSRNFQEYTVTTPTKIDISKLQISFDNDALINGEDRNLYVDKIVLDGVTYETEAPTTYSLGSWNSATGCGGGNKSSEALSCNGYFKFQ